MNVRSRFVAPALYVGGALAVLSLGAEPASAGPTVVYLSQERAVFADISGDTSDSQTQQAPDFGPFNGSVGVSVTGTVEQPTGGTETQTAQSFATQTSTLDQTGIHANGYYEAPSFARMSPTFFFAGRASSDLRVAFELTTPRSFWLEVVPGGRSDENRFRFTGPGDQVIAESVFSRDQSRSDFELDGELAAGTYFLDLHLADIADQGGSTPRSYHLDLELTAPAAVPLPPAVWTGLMTLVGACGASWLRNRLRLARRTGVVAKEPAR